MDDHIKTTLDVASVGTVIATLAGILPAIAALLTIVWTCLRIWESPTIQKIIRGRSS